MTQVNTKKVEAIDAQFVAVRCESTADIFY